MQCDSQHSYQNLKLVCLASMVLSTAIIASKEEGGECDNKLVSNKHYCKEEVVDDGKEDEDSQTQVLARVVSDIHSLTVVDAINKCKRYSKSAYERKCVCIR